MLDGMQLGGGGALLGEVEDESANKEDGETRGEH